MTFTLTIMAAILRYADTIQPPEARDYLTGERRESRAYLHSDYRCAACVFSFTSTLVFTSGLEDGTILVILPLTNVTSTGLPRLENRTVEFLSSPESTSPAPAANPACSALIPT